VREVLARRSRRPSLAPGLYLRLPLVGYLGGIDSKRGIAWRAEAYIPKRMGDSGHRALQP
jgi:hypothetical protein